MSLVRLTVLYGHLEGAAAKFARDPSGHLASGAGIFRQHGLEVRWEHVQGTEERYRRLARGEAQISLVVGRASLQHFLASRTTRILGCAMNRCPYYLAGNPAVEKLASLKGQTIVCREGPARSVPFADIFQRTARLRLGFDLTLELLESDQAAFAALTDGRAAAALLPRPYAFFAEDQGSQRIGEWPEAVDDPMPITIETTEELLRERQGDFAAFVKAHREGIRYIRSHREEALRLLENGFGLSPAVAAKTCDDYFVCLDEDLMVDFRQLEKLVGQAAPDTPGGAERIAADWVIPGALKQ